MIITKLNGGLGNQLFEYAFARSIQIDNNDELWLDLEGFHHTNPNEPVRSFSLGEFNLDKSVRILPLEDSRNLVILQGISSLSRKVAYYIGKLCNVYMWKTANYRDMMIPNTKGKKCYLYGYWQSEKYFYKNREIIKKELKVKKPPIPESKQYVSEADLPNSVCVHIRRGDYVAFNMIFCDESYYRRGMDYIYRIHPDCNFLIFSDDIQWVKDNIKSPYPVTYVEIDDPDYEVLRLMYLCKHFVISNSSFSWWAQYLSESTEKIVVAPPKWFPREDYDKSIYQTNWVIL